MDINERRKPNNTWQFPGWLLLLLSLSLHCRLQVDRVWVEKKMYLHFPHSEVPYLYFICFGKA